MSHTIYAVNGKVSHIHRRMCWWDYTEWITRSFVSKAKKEGMLEYMLIHIPVHQRVLLWNTDSFNKLCTGHDYLQIYTLGERKCLNTNSSNKKQKNKKIAHHDKIKHEIFNWFMVCNATFNYISVLSWRSVLLTEEIEGPGENCRLVTSH